MSNCDRCGKLLNNVSGISWFTEEILCGICIWEEQGAHASTYKWLGLKYADHKIIPSLAKLRLL